VEGIEADRRACEEHVRQSPAMAVALAPSLGYAATAELALAAKKAGKSILDMATEEGLLDAKELERLLSPEAMTELGHRRRSSRGT
jgi:aspartate ammonia-lyase